jgi:hypothetical protein
MRKPELTNAEIERLSLLAEEASEVVKACMKILRHGYENSYDNGQTNRAALEEELGHEYYARILMLEAGDIDIDKIIQSRRAKVEKGTFLHFQ